MTDKPTEPKQGETEKRGKRRKRYIEEEWEKHAGEYYQEFRYDDYQNGIADAYTYVRRRLN